MAVVTALEFHDFISSCKSPGHPDGTHDSLCAGAYQPAHFHRRHQFGDELCQTHFPLRRRTESQSGPAGLRYFLDHPGVCMAQNPRPPGADIVYHLIAVHIHDSAAMGGGNKPWGPAHCAEGPDRTVDSSRNMPLRLFK